MASRGTRASSFLSENPVLTGTLILAVALIGTVLSYNANKGLPFVPTYEITADVPDAAELVIASSEVRIGGARVGLVTDVQAMPPRDGKPSFARLSLALERDVPELPVDSRVKVRPRSVLGAKYVELRPGKAKDTVPPGGALPLANADPLVELDEAFKVFNKETTDRLDKSITELGNAFAGRGSAFNESVVELRRLLPPAQRVLRMLTDPRTDLEGFIRGAAAATGALAPVATELASLIDRAAVTLGALENAGSALNESIRELAPTEIVGARVLRRAEPVLADAAALARGLRDGTSQLPETTLTLARTLERATPVLGRAPALADRLGTTIEALDRLAREPATSGAIRKLIDTVRSVIVTTNTLNPAQITCNVLGIWTRNIADTVAVGDADGSWLAGVLMLHLPQTLQSARPANDLHVNPTPNVNAQECEVGNEPYSPGQVLTNPPGLQPASTQNTAALNPVETAPASLRSGINMGGRRAPGGSARRDDGESSSSPLLRGGGVDLGPVIRQLERDLKRAEAKR